MSKVTEITPAEFADRVLRSPLPTLVDFSASWCSPCRMMAPALDHVAAEFSQRACFFMLDAEEAQDLAQQYAVESVPTLLAFKHGQVVGRRVGYSSRSDLGAFVEQLLG